MPSEINKKRILAVLVILAAIVIAAVAISAVLSGNEDSDSQIQPGEGESADLFPYKVDTKYAEGFKVEYFNNYKVVKIIDPWGRETEDCTYLLVQKGTKTPTGYDGATVYSIPVENAVPFSTTHIPHIVNIGESESIKAVNGIKSVNTQVILDRFEAGLICDIGTPNSNGMIAGMDAEKLIETEPDVIFVSAMDNPEYDNNRKLKEIGLKSALVSEWMEKSPLARAEWVKYFSLFYNKENEADALFDEIEFRYLDSSKKANEVTQKPTVFTGNNYQGTWHIPGGKSYVAQMLGDAGVDYIFSEDTSTGSVPLDFELVYDSASEADFWLNPGVAGTKDAIMAEDTRYSKFTAFQNGKIYNHNARVNEFGGDDYWESGVARPDIVLLDMIKIFHPEIVPDHELYYYKLVD